MKHTLIIALTTLLLAPLAGLSAADALVVYPPVPGLAASSHYTVRVRPARDGSAWQSAFPWETACKTVEKNTDACFDHLAGWTHTYVNFETAGAVLPRFRDPLAHGYGEAGRTVGVGPRQQE